MRWRVPGNCSIAAQGLNVLVVSLLGATVRCQAVLELTMTDLTVLGLTVGCLSLGAVLGQRGGLATQRRCLGRRR